MPTRNTKFYSFILLITDFVVLAIAFVGAYIVRVQLDPRPLLDPVYARDYFTSFLITVPFWLIIFAALGLYGAGVYSRRLAEWWRIAIGTLIGILFVIGFQYASGHIIFPARLVAVYALVGAFVLLIIEREVLRGVRSYMFRHGRGVSRVLLIGNSEATRDIALSLANTRRSGFHISAIAGPKTIVPDQLTNVIQYSQLDAALDAIEKNRITTIIQTDLYDSAQRNEKILAASQIHHINYNFIPGEAEFYAGKNSVDIFLGYPMISVSQTPLIGWGAIVKRIFDQIVSILVVIIFSPIYLILFICQKLFNPGPIFYISPRLSRFSSPVGVIKFRSMGAQYGRKDAALEFADMGRDDLVREYEKNRKVENDPRITRFGHFLRATSLDELPQLFNVVKGELSLVGPRPILPQEVKFSPTRTALLHSVKSGVTGLWQVSGRSNLSFDERIDLELYYARNWSFWLDLKIILKTPIVVLFRRGAK